MELPAPNESSRPAVRLTVDSIPASESPVPALRLWSIRRSISLAVAAALVLVGALIAAALWYAGWPSIHRDETVTAAALFDLLKLVFAVVAGLGGVAALVVAYRRQRVAEQTNALAEFAHQLAHAADLRAEVTKALAEAAEERAKIETDRNGVRLFNERFAKASEQLGSEKAAVRLAGVYAMAGLADDWREGRQTCIDVLCAYLRMPYMPPEASREAPRQADGQASIVDTKTARTAREEREVRHSVIRLIAQHLRLSELDPASWGDVDFDLTGAVIDGGDFSGAVFSGGRVCFSGATFGGLHVPFEGATFSGGEVIFDEATFLDVRMSFDRAMFNGGLVSFAGVAFDHGRVSFDGATFNGGQLLFEGAAINGGLLSFEAAVFSGGRTSFAGVVFGGGRVSFNRVALDGGQVLFDEAVFAGGVVSFDGAMFDGVPASFCGAIFSGGAVRLDEALFRVPPTFSSWPDGYSPDGLVMPGG
ncbi:pentapeptide repeat-containing protein [Micromonospora taraxaci]|uniref:pentapeptide repeat-containing protein n=1 Tax=Micromonospora taraxaci TaxID=1316803 RepID=UPI003C2C6685